MKNLPFNLQELSTDAGAALAEQLRDASDDLKLDAKRILESTEDGKAPMLSIGFTIKVDLRTGGVSFKLSGGSRYKIEGTAQLKLDFASA